MLSITSGKVRFSEKIGYIMANLGNIPIITFVSSFLMLFYTNVVGLKPVQVATLFLIARIIDAVNDPIVGYLIDHTPAGRMGKFRKTLMIGSILCGLNYLLLWFGPVWMPGIKLFIAYISYLLIGVTFPVMDISLNSLLPVMTDDLKERNTLSTLKGLFYMLGAMAFSIIAPIVVSTGELKAYYALVFVIVVFVISFSVAGALLVKENIAVPSDNSEKYKFRDIFKIFSVKPVLYTFLAIFIGGTGQMMYNASNSYYFTYIFNDLGKMSLVMVASMVGILPAMGTSQLWIAKFGKKRLFTISFLLITIGFLARLISLTSIPVAMTGSIISGFGIGFFMPLTYSLIADNTNYVEYTKNIRAEAVIASLSSFTAKFSQGIGGAVPGYILAATGFSASASAQNQSTITGIVIAGVILPAIIVFAGGLIFASGYNLTSEKLVQINDELIRRHNAASDGIC